MRGARVWRGLSRMLPLCAVAVVAACGPDRLAKTEANLAQAVAEASTRGDTATLWLFVEVPFAYDRVYIAGPGTSAEQIRTAFNSDEWFPELTRGIEGADHFHLLLFETRGKLVPATLPRSVADIDPSLTGKMYGPNDARFSVRRLPDSAAPILTALPQPQASAESAPE